METSGSLTPRHRPTREPNRKLPLDEELELSVFVRGADDAVELQVCAEVRGGVALLVVRQQAAQLLLRLENRKRRGNTCDRH